MTEGMIKVSDIDRFPVDEVMTLETIGSEASLMRILMAVRASWRDSQECLAKSGDLNNSQFVPVNMFDGMAALTGKTDMFSFQGVSGLSVIKDVDIPFCQRGVITVVLGVAVDALIAGLWFEVVRSVKASAGGDSRFNFFVASQTSKGSLSGRKLMTACAIRQAFHRAVCVGEGTRRNLTNDRNGAR